MTSSPKNNRASLLTIAIPTFDREEYLRETLLSLLRQTEQRFEIILFDNASPYDIEKFVHEFETLKTKIMMEQRLTSFVAPGDSGSGVICQLTNPSGETYLAVVGVMLRAFTWVPMGEDGQVEKGALEHNQGFVWMDGRDSFFRPQ